MFQEGTFDLTIAKNTLDHGIDPLKAIKEMIKVTKPGGVIVTQHWANEAVKENYQGFHQWNFFVDKRCLYVGNRAERINVTNEVSGTIEFLDLSQDSAEYVTSVMRRCG